jgi:acyl-CoA reductase-like NAD-dependent aldehyde dehydrogenase
MSSTIETASAVTDPYGASLPGGLPGGLPGSTPGPARAVESRDPATGEVWRTFATTSRDEVEAATARARKAQSAWAAQPLAVRIEVLRRFHEALFRRRIEVAEAVSRENGKPVGEAIGAEIATVLDFADYYAAKAPGFLKAPWRGSFAMSMKRKRVRIAREPLGVIGIISPWNYPFMLASAAILPAIVTGNAVILKPSEFTPTSGALIGELFAEAGLPDGVLQVQDFFHRQRRDGPQSRDRLRRPVRAVLARTRRERPGDRAGGREYRARGERYCVGAVQ